MAVSLTRAERPKGAALLVAAVLLMAIGAARPPTVHGAATFVVNRIGDAPDLNLANAACDVSTNSGKQCTLRAAIQEANDTPGADIINFNITSASKVIAPASPLPPITDEVTINGYSQSGAVPNSQAVGSNAVLRVVLDGVNAGTGADGLVIDGYKINVRGLVIQRWDGRGVVISGIKSSIQGNRIGTNAAGTAALGNGEGVRVTGDQNNIGGITPEARNLISGNLTQGIRITGLDAVANIVVGNYVGTTAAGGAGLGNGGTGIVIGSQATLNRVGGTTPGSGNVVSANAGHGIGLIASDETTVVGNLIGTKADGTGDLGNAEAGITVQGSSDNIIGGAASGWANVISGNGASGVDLYGTATFDNVVRGNVIRLNDEHGVRISSRRGLISGNVIFGNALDGIHIFELAAGTANRNRITANQMFGNGELGIDLAGGTENASGVTANDGGAADDADLGPNDLQNYPALTSAIRGSDGLTTITGILDSAASAEYEIELYFVAADGSDHGEGQVRVASHTITTRTSGERGFTIKTNQLAAGQRVTATATRVSTGSTSEFSLNIVVSQSQGS